MAPSRLTLALLLAAGGCGFSIRGGGAGDDQVPDGRAISIVDDARDDFAGTRFESTIAARGAIEPDAFVLNGLHARAFDSTFGGTASYSEALASATNPLGEGYRQVPYRYDAFGSDHPHGLGIGFSDFSIFYDGEIYLPAGAVDIELDADDRCIVELQLDGATWSSFKDAFDTPNPRTAITVPAAGWYPIRAAFVQGIGSSLFEMFYTPAGGARVQVDASVTRVRVTDTPGLIVDTFTPREMARTLGSLAVQNVDQDFGNNAPPFDLNLPISNFALRYTGQLRIDTAGRYTFSADASTSGSNGGDLWRLWIDGVAIAGPWSKDRMASASVDLLPGWHDFGVDFADDELDARIRARMSGPGIPEGVIEASRLRPAVATGLTALVPEQSQTTILDASGSVPGETSIDLSVAGSPGAKIVSVDWGFGTQAARMTDLTAKRIDCSSLGTMAPLGANNAFVYFANDTTCRDTPLPLAWKYVVTDAVQGGSVGNVYSPLLAVTYRGGEKNAPFARSAVFTSSVRETPNAIGYGRVVLTADARAGSVLLEVRTAADATSIESAPWVAVADGEVPVVEPGAVLQYRVTLDTAGGWELVSVDRVEIVYIVPG